MDTVNSPNSKNMGKQCLRPAAPYLVMVAVFCVLAGTSQMLPLTWDEGELISRAAAVKQWGERAVISPWGDAEHASPFSRESITESWTSTTVSEGHPGGYLAVIALGRTLAELINGFSPDFMPDLSPKTSWRLGPILLMSLALGVMFSAIRRYYDTAAALFSVAAVLLVPRVFAHSHLATCDGVLMAAWLLAVATFPLSRETSPSRKQAILSGIVWGMCFGLTLAAKFTGWAMIAAFLGFGIWDLRVRSWKNRKTTDLAKAISNSTLQTQHSKLVSCTIGVCVAALVFYLLNPPLWHRPFSGLAEFFYLNTHRGQFNISILFWGQIYDLEKSLPWYNTLVWVAITFPTLFFVMLPFGVHRMFPRVSKSTVSPDRESSESRQTLANRKRFGWLIVFNAVVLLIVRAIPGTPPHDGVRLFVVAFPFLAIIAGIGMSVLWQMRRSVLIGRLVVVFVLVVGVGNLVFYAPQWLSFYNAVIGGVSGAAQKGFEPTYYWDAFDAEVIAVLNNNTAEQEKIRLTRARSSKTFDLVRAWDGLRPEFRPDAPGKYRWYVFQRRPSGMSAVDRILLRDFEPAWVKTVSQPTFLFLQTRETPVLYVFEHDDYLEAVEKLENKK